VAPNEGYALAQPSEDVLRGPWWKMFGDAELDALEEQVDISNQNIARAEAQYREALALVREARASYYPTVSVRVGVVRTRAPGSGTTERLYAAHQRDVGAGCLGRGPSRRRVPAGQRAPTTLTIGAVHRDGSVHTRPGALL